MKRVNVKHEIDGKLRGRVGFIADEARWNADTGKLQFMFTPYTIVRVSDFGVWINHILSSLRDMSVDLTMKCDQGDDPIRRKVRYTFNMPTTLQVSIEESRDYT